MADYSKSLQAQLDAKPMTSLQWRVVALCWMLNILDGFDLTAISFAAPVIAKTWQIAPQTLGIVFSSALVGMTASSLLLGPLADHIGRRRMILLATCMLGLSTLATAAAVNVIQLVLLRGLTGIAIGVLLPCLNTLVAEYTPDRKRNLAISFMHLGYPLGGVAGGLLASQIIPSAGWQAVFFIGGIVPLIMLPLVLLGLPESLHYLLQKNRPGAKAAAEKLARSLRIDLDAAQIQAVATGPARFKDVLSGQWLAPGLALWACFFLGYLTLYFLLNWTPTILVEAGLPNAQAMRAGMLLNLGGAIGMLSLGYLSARWSIYRMMSGYFILGALVIMLIGQMPKSADLLLIIITLGGFFSLGGLISLYSLAARLYPDATRVTGVSLAIGAGRFGAILGPYVGGALISMGWPMGSYFVLLALPLIAVAALLWRVRRPEGLA